MAEIKRVGVVGAGLMGHGIAQVAAEAGYDVVLRDVEQRFVDAGLAGIEKQLSKAVAKGKATQEDADAVLARVTGTTELEALADRDIVVEAIPEVLDLKRALWTELDGIVKDAGIFATNTSALSVVDQAAVTKRPDRFVGLHFFSPVQRMALVEVVRAITTSDETMAAAEQWVSGIRKQPIPTRDTAGFVVNRLLVPYMADAIRALEEGVGTADQIDAAMKAGAGHPVGPLMLNDLVGLDTLMKTCENMYAELRNERFAPPPTLRKLVAAGWFGRKTGMGFYDWSGPEPVPNAALAR
ncbi:MAG TPA: 3-hydroxyacyl-CoA dehydrogenase family protein [Solirubrobacteraceae bacterium]|nr:3-hydroxyacyl-CoA dehydrogenase family protein [Solirubrobacteraceae bacterium]